MKFTERGPFITIICLICFIVATVSCQGQHKKDMVAAIKDPVPLQTGADRTDVYLPLLEGKRVAMVVNQSSMTGGRHLLDVMLENKIDIVRIFGPEHGVRGDFHDGAEIADGKDPKTGIPVISLYGKKKKPAAQDLEGIDQVVFDIQDAGVRCYTYLSTLAYVMEACAEKGISVMVLDRPNPNGFYIDGPVLEEEYSSFVGLHPVPLVYGMTIGEYAKMINGEKWLAEEVQCELMVIPMRGYERNNLYKLNVPPSPNLPDWKSVYLYPSLVLLEGTIMSVGRGTDHPFQVIGHPDFAIGSFTFMPESRPGASLHPKYEGEQCFGLNLSGYAENFRKNEHHLTLIYVLGAFEYFSENGEDHFFTDYFEKIAGTGRLREQIEAGVSEDDIRTSWEEELESFRIIRNKYLIYNDF